MPFAFWKKKEDDDSDESDDKPKVDVLKVSPWDMASMKRTIDEHTPKVSI